MALPNAYLTTVKNLDGILNAIKTAKAPPKFTQAFLESLEFKSNSDRLIIGVLKALGFLNDQGAPQDRYFRFLDQTQSDKVLAEAIEDAYADLFQVNTKANELSAGEIKNKLKTLSQGQVGDAVLDKMSMTFRALCDLADFKTSRIAHSSKSVSEVPDKVDEDDKGRKMPGERIRLDGLVYNIQIHLPESRDHTVYDAIFRSLRDHLLP